jgi:nucleotide-binding universal stress UspA family protein
VPNCNWHKFCIFPHYYIKRGGYFLGNNITNEFNYKPTDYKTIKDEHQIKRAWVVINPDLVKPSALKESALVTRAIALLKAKGCELHFFHLRLGDSLTTVFFSNNNEVLHEQLKCLNQEATLISELVVRLSSEDVNIKHETRWGTPRLEAVLLKINESQPDLMIKQSRSHSYVMAQRINTDWDLIHHSPAHFWFVNEKIDDNIDSLVTAVDASTNNDNIIAAADYRVFRMSNLLAEFFDATNTPVHTYQVPAGMSTYATYTPVFGGFSSPTESEGRSAQEARQQITKKHSRCIEVFSKYFHINPERVRIAQGQSCADITEAALEVDANLIVVAASNLSRWERWCQCVMASHYWHMHLVMSFSLRTPTTHLV